VAVRCGADVADHDAVAVDHLAVVQERLWVGEQHLHQPAGEHARAALRPRRLDADEAARLVEGGREAKPRLVQRVEVVEVMAVVAVPLLEAERTESLEAGMH